MIKDESFINICKTDYKKMVEFRILTYKDLLSKQNPYQIYEKFQDQTVFWTQRCRIYENMQNRA